METAALAALRKEIDALDKTDVELAWVLSASDLQCSKFLTGHKYKVQECLDLMVKCSRWRHKYGTDKLVEKYESPTTSALSSDLKPEMIRFANAYLPMGMIGHDFEGRPIMMQRLSAIDFPRVIGDLGLDRIIEYGIYVQEKLLNASMKNEKHPGECMLILDMGIEDLKNPPMTTLMEARSWIQGLLKFLQPFAGIVDPFYPEMFHKIFFTRTPSMFAAAWSIAKAFVADQTREKIEILTNKNCTKRLLECFPADAVPHFLGGTNALLGLGRGGKLPKTSVLDPVFIDQLEQVLREEKQQQADTVIATPEPVKEEEESEVTKRVALDLLRVCIQAELAREHPEAGEEVGKEFLETLEDAELEQTLVENEFDHLRSFAALQARAKLSISPPIPAAATIPEQPQQQTEKKTWYSRLW